MYRHLSAKMEKYDSLNIFFVSFASRQKKGIKDRSENFVSKVRILQISINGFAELRVYSEPREFDFVRTLGYGCLIL